MYNWGVIRRGNGYSGEVLEDIWPVISPIHYMDSYCLSEDGSAGDQIKPGSLSIRRILVFGYDVLAGKEINKVGEVSII
ncbi:hypothetical protein Tco_0133095 [Tanacetum coccineum]